MTRRLVLAILAAALTLLPIHHASAFFGFGGIVYDPTNHAENILTAARSLEQVRNQVRQLSNEARMLVNQARDLASLPDSIASDIHASLEEVNNLMREADGIAYRISEIDETWRRLFPREYARSVSSSDILQDARDSWDMARQGFRHALEIQAGIVENIASDTDLLDRLVGQSQSAIGGLQAAQAGNQLSALATKQMMQLQGLLAASFRAEALERADALAAHERGQARFRRFLGDGSAYTPL